MSNKIGNDMIRIQAATQQPTFSYLEETLMIFAAGLIALALFATIILATISN